ncbi:hypothetical protein L1R86_22450 [Klebsiella pneumoniae]
MGDPLMEEKKLEEVVITKEKVIFVEGMDEVNFFYALLKKWRWEITIK